MAAKSYKFIDRRGTNAGLNYFGATLTGFADASKVSVQREQFENANRDSRALVGAEDRRRLLTVGRHLYQRDEVVMGVLDQMASLATKIVTPQFDGEDTEWGTVAESWLHENDKWIDVRGWPFCMSDQDRLIALQVIRDGDIAEIITEDENGDPKTQLIPAHRIGTRSYSYGDEEVKSGPFKGRRIIDGVIVGDSLETLGYRVMGDKPEQDVDYSVNDMRLHFHPKYSDQVRGFSWLGASAIGIQDTHEARKLELIAQKNFASTTVLEHNETGQADGGLGTILAPGTEATTTEVAIAPIFGQAIEGGTTRYFRAGSNSKWEIPVGDRPTMNQREFSADVIRKAIHAMGWSVDFFLDATRIGGASMRVVVDNINSTLDTLRGITVRRRKWVDAWRIAKAIKNGRIPHNDEWWKWEYQFARRITADRKYDSETNINETTAGFGTQADACAASGLWWQDVNKQKERELRDKLTRAKEIAAEFDITMQEAMVHLGLLHPMQLFTLTQNNQAKAGQTQDPPAH